MVNEISQNKAEQKLGAKVGFTLTIKTNKSMAKKIKNLTVETSATAVLETPQARIPSQEDIVTGLLENPALVRTTACFKQVMLPVDSIQVNEENRGGVPFDWDYIENKLVPDMIQNGWKAGSILEVENLTKGAYLCWSGNNRLLAARKAGFLSVPCIILPQMSKTDRLVFGWKANEVKRNSPVETALIVGSLAKEGNKPGDIANLMFAGSKGGASQVSQHLAFVKSCPAWLLEAVKSERVAFATAKDLIPLFTGADKDSEATIAKRNEIESSPSGSLVGIKIVKEARENKAKIAREQVEKAAKATKDAEIAANKEKADKEKAEAIANALSDKVQLEKHSALVKDVSELLALPQGEDSQDEAFDAMETLIIATHGEQSYKNEAKRQLDAKSLGATQGNIVPPTTPSDIAATLDKQGASESTPGTIEGTSKPLTEAEKAAILANPTVNEVNSKTGTQANPEQQVTKSVSMLKGVKRITALQNALNALIATIPTDTATHGIWLDRNCRIGLDGHAYLTLSLGHATQRFSLDLGQDMTN